MGVSGLLNWRVGSGGGGGRIGVRVKACGVGRQQRVISDWGKVGEGRTRNKSVCIYKMMKNRYKTLV